MLPPRAFHCDTEYRRSFKKSRFNCSATTYQHNLDFRTEQKRRFVEHNREPFAWDPEDIESESGSDRSCEEEVGRSNRLTHTQYKHEKLNRLYEKRMSRKQEGHGNRDTGKESMRDVTRKESDDEREETDEEEEDGESESESEASVVHIIEPEFLEEPVGRTVANKQTQTERETIRHKEKRSSPAPFVPYGYEADVKEIGKKPTHNVRAARDVYPSALRAQKNRRTASQQNRTQGKSGQALLGKSQVADHLRLTSSEPFGIYVHSDNPDWVTEYDRNFQPYDPKVYRSRPDSARVHARELVPQLSGKARKQTRR